MENQQQNKLPAIIAYITIVGWIIAFLIRDKDDAFQKVHINQALIIGIAGAIGGAFSFIPILGAVISLVVFIFAVLGLIRAIQGSSEPLPLIGGITLIK